MDIFEKKRWLNDDMQNVTKLRSLLDSGNSGFVIQFVNDDGTMLLSATWQEIADAMKEGKSVIVVDADDTQIYICSNVLSVYYDAFANGNKYFVFLFKERDYTFSCSSSNTNPYYEL